MPELSTSPDQSTFQEQAPVDLIVGVADAHAAEHIEHVIDVVSTGLSALQKPQQAVIAYKSGYEAPPVIASNSNHSVRLLSYASPTLDPSASFANTISNDYRAIANASSGLNAKAYVLIASSFETATPQWIFDLAQPLVEHEFDFVSPCYSFQKFEAILNNAVLYPFIRCLYGKRIENPLGPDIGLSARFLRQVLVGDAAKPRQGIAPRITVPLGAEAASRELKICQANLGERKYPPVDWKNISSLLAEVLGPLFQQMERDAAIWQRVRGSEPVPVVGPALNHIDHAVAVDIRPLIEPFQLGFRNLQEIWALVLPPKTLFELQRLGRKPAEEFHMSDDLWARIIFDFSLGYRLRTINRDHLLRALTPLYLGCVASYALEAQHASASAAQHRIERLCEAFEAGKPYLVSRWRWPDRFNP